MNRVIADAKYAASPKGRERNQRYKDSALGVFARVRAELNWNAKRRGTR